MMVFSYRCLWCQGGVGDVDRSEVVQVSAICFCPSVGLLKISILFFSMPLSHRHMRVQLINPGPEGTREKPISSNREPISMVVCAKEDTECTTRTLLCTLRSHGTAPLLHCCRGVWEITTFNPPTGLRKHEREMNAVTKRIEPDGGLRRLKFSELIHVFHHKRDLQQKKERGQSRPTDHRSRVTMTTRRVSHYVQRRSMARGSSLSRFFRLKSSTQKSKIL